MKALRVLLWCVGITLLLLVAAVAVALNSSFQTWAARRALASQRDVTGTIGTVSAGFGGIEIREAKLAASGAVLTLPSLRADFPLVAAGLSRRVSVATLVAKGWTLDLTHAATALPTPGSPVTAASRPAEFSLFPAAYAAEAAQAAAVGFSGVLAPVRLPLDLSLQGVDLEGDVLLPAKPAQGPSRLHVTIRGGGLGAGAKGAFVVDASGVQGDGGTVQVHATVAATMDTPRTFTQLSAAVRSAVAGTQFPEGVNLNVDAVVDRTASGETYSALLSNPRKELAMLKGELVSSASRISGSWRVDLQDADVSPFLFGRRLPTFAARGEGAFETSTALKEVHVSGKLKASAEHLDVVRHELAAVGPVEVSADFDLLQHGASLRVERLDAVVAGPAPLATMRALQPFEFNVSTAELRVADPGRDLVALKLDGLPLAWAQPLLGDLIVTGGNAQGEFVAGAREGGLALRARAPLTLNHLSATRRGELLLKDVDLTVDASADYTLRGWQVELVQLAARSGGAVLLQLEAKAGQLAGADRAIKATGRWSANLAAATAQPGLARQLRLAAGDAHGEFTASLDGIKAVEAGITLSGMVGAAQEKLPAISLQLRADVDPESKVTFKAPLLLERDGRKSDLLLTGTLTPRTASTAVEARLTSELIYVEDVKVLTVLTPGGEAPAPSSAGPKTAGPFWTGWTGQVVLALKKVVYSPEFEVTDVGGTLRVDPTALTLDALHAAFGAESDMKASGGLKYDSSSQQPYALGLDATLNNFDTGPAFRAIDPAKLPTVEGRVNLTTHLSGAGENLAQATERARGDLQVTGRSGVFRALSADLTGKVEKTQSTVAAIGGLLGAVTGKKEYVDYAARTQILSDIAKSLSEIPFDQLNVTATRDPGLNIALKDFTLISPEIRLTGGGGIRYADATSLLEQPLQLELQLGARGKFGELLKRAGLLDTKKDSLGYTSLSSPIRIGGTLAKTDTSELLKMLLNSTLLK